jgi:hypothetical protein
LPVILSVGCRGAARCDPACPDVKSHHILVLHCEARPSSNLVAHGLSRSP